MEGHNDRAANGGILPNPVVLDQRTADERFDDGEEEGEERGLADTVLARECAECPDYQRGNGQPEQAAHGAVRELDGELEAPRSGDDLAVAERPMAAASVPRITGAHECAPDNDGQ